jgi:hypothetical protein
MAKSVMPKQTSGWSDSSERDGFWNGEHLSKIEAGKLELKNAADPSRAADPDRLLVVRSCLYDHFKTTVDHALSVKWHRVRTRL